MVPATTNLVPIFKNIVGVHLTNSFIPLWLSFGANAFNVLLYKSFFDGIPRSLIEAARLDGCNDFQIFYKLILPLSKAVNMVVIIFSLNAAWSDFLLPMLVLKDTDKYTVMLKIYYMSTGNNAFSVDYRLLALGFSIIPPAILFIFFQKYITKGLALSGIKG
ncbi:carbohydrate ABC transporter permease [Clostridium sp. DMHC 10]|nr:carbohydrate ABC transporter permease [Clostridium sp. DMHC 10]